MEVGQKPPENGVVGADPAEARRFLLIWASNCFDFLHINDTSNRKQKYSSGLQVCRVVFEGGSRGTYPSLAFPSTGLLGNFPAAEVSFPNHC